MSTFSAKGVQHVFVGCHEVAGYYTRLAQGFGELGVPVTMFFHTEHVFDYRLTKGTGIQSFYLLEAVRAKQKKTKNFVMRKLIRLIWQFLKIYYFIKIAFTADAFIFGYGISFFESGIDQRILKFLGKVVVVNIGHGSEARPIYLNGFLLQSETSAFQLKDIVSASAEQRKKIERVVESATYVVGSPMSSNFYCRRPFISYQCLGNPIHLEGYSPCAQGTNDCTAVVLHCPSNPATKGTDHILRMIDELQEEGVSIALKVVSGKPSSEVMKALVNCDFVIDQCFNDTFLATFAAEAALTGKCAIVGCNNPSFLREVIPHKYIPPVILCKPSEMKGKIKRLAKNLLLARRLGISAARYAQNNLQSKLVAGKYLAIFSGDIPSDWWVTDLDKYFIDGAGQSSSQTRDILDRIVHEYGEGALCLDSAALDSVHLLLASRSEE